MISFVFYFHSQRIKNLEQTLRFLFNRESRIGEVILICNDYTEQVFPGCTVYNMRMNTYKKPSMCNLGVSKAKFDLVALMDSDRILPEGYFSSLSPKPGEFVACDRLANLSVEYSDEEIESGRVEYYMEIKSRKAKAMKKNLFSGNTVFYKQDYLDAGGMDESFVGYGFADNDMTMNIISKGYKPIWKDDIEMHLRHERSILFEGKKMYFMEYEPILRENMKLFMRKWTKMM